MYLMDDDEVQEKPSPLRDLRRFFARKFEKLKNCEIQKAPKEALTNLADKMLQKRRKHKFSTGQQKMKDVSEAFQQNLLRDIKLDSPFREHQMTIEQLVDIYPLSRINHLQPTKSVGLNDDEAEIKLSSAPEKNVIYPKNRKGGKFQAFLHQFKNTFRILLLIATLCCFLIFALDQSHVKELAMGIILAVVLIVMCLISYYEELNTIKQISTFQSMIAIDCTVIRCARKIIVPASDLIIGDLVWIQNGDRIPADMRLIYCDDLQVETSWLSGEVEPLPYTDEPAGEDVGVFESQNIVFSGCSVTSGRGLGLVIRVGNSTVLGNLVEITSKEKTHKAPLQIEHHRFVLFISISAIIVATISFLLGLILSSFSHILSTFVNGFLIVLVAWVPQGLPVTLTAQLLIVARRLAKFGMYLKNLECADTLGITSILMVDKTGVLTQDDLRVTDLWTLESSVSAKDIIEAHQKSLGSSSPENLKPKYHLSDSNCNLISGIEDIFGVLITVMSICDKAIIESSHHSAKINLPRKTPSFRRKNLLSLNPEDLSKANKAKQRQVQFALKHKDLKEKSIIGKSLDVALVKFVENVTSVDKIRDDYEIVFEVPFSSQRRFHLVIVCAKSSKKSCSGSSYSDELVKYTVMVKGAPEEVIMNCDTIVTENGEEKINDDKLLEFEKAFLQFCNEGKSCLGFAMREFEDFSDTVFYMNPTGSNFPDEKWCFLGMTALYDPPIPGVAEAVKAADKADIRLFMISGDHPVTSEALARQMQFDFGDSNIAAADASIASIASGIVGEGVDVEKVSSRKSSMSSTTFSTNSIRIDPIANLECIRGEMVKELSQADWARLLSRKRVVFARTTPLQKMKIVKSCQLSNAIVAVTGDGVMAAPALKQADVGLAMEAVGSIFAKEAADIVVTQPQLPNLIAAIAEARLLFDNLKKTIAYSLSHLMPEVIPVWFTFVLGFPIGLNSIQILTIDLLSEIPPSIALVFEPAERDLMRRSPRKKKSLLVTKALLAYSYCFAGMIISIGCILSYFTVFWSYEIGISDLFNSDTKYWSLSSPNLTLSSGQNITASEQTQIYEEASAAWHITLVMSQAFHLWMCTTRRISLFKHGFRNWTLFAAVLFEIATLFVFIFVPGINNFLQVSPPAWYIWLYPVVVGIILMVFNEIRKYFIRKNPKNSIVRIFKW